MTAIIGALVPLVVALISSLRWPTLRRRIHAHTALLKDLPAAVAGPLTELLQAELDELVRRDQRRLNRKLNKLLAARWLLVTLILAATSALVFELLASEPPASSAPPLGWQDFVLVGFAAVLAAITGVVVIRTRRLSARTERLTVSEVIEQLRREQEQDDGGPPGR